VNCREFEGLLGAYADQELDLVNALGVESHLRECRTCEEALRRLAALRTVAAEAPYYSAPEGLRARLTRPERKPVLWPWYSVAACAAAFLLLTPYWTLRQNGSPLLKEVVAAHVRSLQASHLMDVPSTDRHTVKPWFTGKLDFAPEVSVPEGFELVGGRLDYVDGQPVAALVYRRRQHTINVFTWPATATGESLRAESVNGFNVIHWVRGGMNWWAVSDLASAELREISVGQAARQVQ
jgi:anti-sigma factor RsiW